MQHWLICSIQVLIYALVDFVPYALLSIYPFQGKLRFRKSITIGSLILLAICYVVNEFLMITVFPNYVEEMSIINILLCAAIYFILVRDKLGKTLFTLLLIDNCSNFITVTATYLAKKFSNTPQCIPDHWTITLTIIILQLFILLPLGIYFKKIYKSAIEMSYERIWDYLWIIPAIFFFFYKYIIHNITVHSTRSTHFCGSPTIFLHPQS